jgi:hypothetical protein
MNAKSAKIITEDTINKSLEPIFELIIKEAKEGNYSILINRSNISHLQILYLTSIGYKITYINNDEQARIKWE